MAINIVAAGITPTLASAWFHEGGRTPVLPRARLTALGYGLAIYPATSLMAAVHAMQRTYASLLPDRDGVKLDAPLIDLAGSDFRPGGPGTGGGAKARHHRQ